MLVESQTLTYVQQNMDPKKEEVFTREWWKSLMPEWMIGALIRPACCLLESHDGEHNTGDDVFVFKWKKWQQLNMYVYRNEYIHTYKLCCASSKSELVVTQLGNNKIVTNEGQSRRFRVICCKQGQCDCFLSGSSYDNQHTKQSNVTNTQRDEGWSKMFSFPSF